LPRQQTLRGALEWSYDLLTNPERTLFQRVAIFSGGFTLDAAEAVCSGGEIRREQVLDFLTRLIDKSLINKTMTGTGRYEVLETLRQYACEKLEESGELLQIRNNHRDYFADLAGRAEPNTFGSEQAEWFQLLEREHSNFRAVLSSHRTEPEDVEAALRIIVALRQFWYVRGYYTEGARYAAEVLRSECRVASDLRVRALECAGDLAMVHGDYEAAESFLREFFEKSRAAADDLNLGRACLSLGHLAIRQGAYNEAQSRYT
jgi:non-specific serine/threonine protein kinase